jgi:antitoxin VapB
MPISIKNPETEALARQLAKLTGESLTETIQRSVAQRYERVRQERSGRTLVDELNEIARRCAARPRDMSMTDDEILGYDENGIPTR